MKKEEKLLVTCRQIKLSDIFRNFANALDDPELIEIARQKDVVDQDIMKIIESLKKFAWEKMGGIVLTAYEPGL